MDLRDIDHPFADLSDIPDSSIPLILTNPPQGEAAEPYWRSLGQHGARMLMDGGMLIAFGNGATEARDMLILDEYLTYWWLGAFKHDRGLRFADRMVVSNHDPIFFFVKGITGRRKLAHGRCVILPDLVHTTYDPELPAWAHGPGAPIWQFIEALTDPAEVVIDPFATMAWGHVVQAMGRRWIGTTAIAASPPSDRRL
jgi:hypothetical protein